MCNKLHSDSKPIKASGVGYKLFTKGSRGSLCPMARDTDYEYAPDGWIVWDFFIDRCLIKDHGFCFLLSLKEARRLLRHWTASTCVIHKIQYEEGLGKHKENRITSQGSYVTALCRRFRIMEEVK